MQINRLFEIIYILLEKQTVTSKELSQKFEVSTRTIYRDIETLSSSGIPIYMTKGRGGGISLLPEFILNKTVITDTEKEDILSSLKALKAITPSKSNTALNKLNSLFGNINVDWIEVDFSSWSNSKNDKEIFENIKKAILNKQVINCIYANVKGENKKREVEPLKLCFKGGSWYLYGFCREKEDFRFFKLKRMKEFVISDEFFQRSCEEDIFCEENSFKQDEFIQLKLKLSSKMAYRVYDEFESYVQDEDGNFLAEISYPKNGDWLFYYIATFGEDCEVIEPIEIREEVKKKLKNILKQYI